MVTFCSMKKRFYLNLVRIFQAPPYWLEILARPVTIAFDTF